MSTDQTKADIVSKIQTIENPDFLDSIELFISQWETKGRSLFPEEKRNLDQGIEEANNGKLIDHDVVMGRIRQRIAK